MSPWTIRGSGKPCVPIDSGQPPRAPNMWTPKLVKSPRNTAEGIIRGTQE